MSHWTSHQIFAAPAIEGLLALKGPSCNKSGGIAAANLTLQSYSLCLRDSLIVKAVIFVRDHCGTS